MFFQLHSSTKNNSLNLVNLFECTFPIFLDQTQPGIKHFGMNGFLLL